MSLAVVIPTISGREQLLKECLASLEATVPSDTRIHVVAESPSCGAGWQLGGDEVMAGRTVDYLALATDDVEFHDGWWQAAIEKLDRHELPSATVYNPDGTVQSCGGYWNGLHPDGNPCRGTINPVLNRELWEAVQPVAPFPHMCDVWISEGAVLAGYQPVVCRGYAFTHHVITPEEPGEREAYAEWRDSAAR